ncbi:hypothetical protein N806_10510 [Rhodococcus sp. P27]|nr:hypothetical protein N601_28075 [Rhodococcus erythropolis DN1]ERB51619.1 hypothetical protein N806_10510 [Rhodococcus sp. P27]
MSSRVIKDLLRSPGRVAIGRWFWKFGCRARAGFVKMQVTVHARK